MRAKSPQSSAVADVAQLVEQLIRNQQVAGSNPAIGSIFSSTYSSRLRNDALRGSRAEAAGAKSGSQEAPQFEIDIALERMPG